MRDVGAAARLGQGVRGILLQAMCTGDDPSVAPCAKRSHPWQVNCACLGIVPVVGCSPTHRNSHDEVAKPAW